MYNWQNKKILIELLRYGQLTLLKIWIMRLNFLRLLFFFFNNFVSLNLFFLDIINIIRLCIYIYTYIHTHIIIMIL